MRNGWNEALIVGERRPYVAACGSIHATQYAQSDWPDAPRLAHFILQHACGELIARRRELVVLTETAADWTCALLLGGPAAVGRCNLLPQARLQPLPAVQGGEIGLDLAAAQALGLLPEGARFSHLVGDLPAGDLVPFHAAVPRPGVDGSLFQLPALWEACAGWGLLPSQAPGATLTTILERI